MSPCLFLLVVLVCSWSVRWKSGVSVLLLAVRFAKNKKQYRGS